MTTNQEATMAVLENLQAEVRVLSESIAEVKDKFTEMTAEIVEMKSKDQLCSERPGVEL